LAALLASPPFAGELLILAVAIHSMMTNSKKKHITFSALVKGNIMLAGHHIVFASDG
jgi:hypothetical protein